MFAKRGQGIVVAGEQGEHMRRRIERHGEGALQVRMQGCDLRGQPRLGLPLGPQQLQAEFGQLRRLALVPDDQRLAEFQLPAFELAPDVAVGQTQRFGRCVDRAMVLDSMKQVHQRVAYPAGGGRASAQRIGEFDFVHGAKYGADSGAMYVDCITRFPHTPRALLR